MTLELDLNQSITIGSIWAYATVVFILAVIARILNSLMRAVKYGYDNKQKCPGYVRFFFDSLKGFHRTSDKRPASSDYFFNFFVGLIEIGFYPILLAVGGATAIAAWIGLKSVSHWDVWKTDRSVFQMFLIGNAINVIFAFVFVYPYITVG